MAHTPSLSKRISQVDAFEPDLESPGHCRSESLATSLRGTTTSSIRLVLCVTAVLLCGIVLHLPALNQVHRHSPGAQLAYGSKLYQLIRSKDGGHLIEEFAAKHSLSFSDRGEHVLAQLVSRDNANGGGFQLYPGLEATQGKRVLVLDFEAILGLTSISATSIRHIHDHLTATASAMGVHLELATQYPVQAALPEGSFKSDFMQQMRLKYSRLHNIMVPGVESIVKLARSSPEGFDGLICWNEASQAIAAQVARQLGLPFLSASNPLLAKLGAEPGLRPPTKFEQRQTLKEAGVVGVRFALINATGEEAMWSSTEAAAAEVGFPSFLKPAEGLGMSAGFAANLLKHARVHTREELINSVQVMKSMLLNMSLHKVLNSGLVLEQMLQGPEIYAEVVAFDTVQAISLRADVTSHWSGRPEDFGTISHTFPANLTTAEHTLCLQAAWDAAKGLQLQHGLFGIQLKQDPREGCQFLEINVRPHMWALLFDQEFQMFTQRDYWDYAEVALLVALGIDPSSRMGRDTTPPISLSIICDARASPNGFSGIFFTGQIIDWVDKGICEVGVARDPHAAAMSLADAPDRLRRKNLPVFQSDQ